MKPFYCPRVTYCFTKEDMQTLNERIKEIAQAYDEEDTGWFEVGENEHHVFIDDQDNMFIIHLRGRFWRKDNTEFDLEFFRLEKDGASFNFDIEMFDEKL
jgi:hypothetical protein